MQPRSILLSLSLALLGAGCASTPLPQQAGNTPAPITAPRPFVSRDAEIAYRVLMGELAAERGDTKTAAQQYLAAAGLSDDATLEGHAAMLAYGSGDTATALVAARRWRELDPTNADAAHFVAVLEARMGQVAEAAAEFERLVRSGVDRGFGSAAELLGQELDAAHALPVLERIVGDEPSSADAQLALADGAMHFKRYAAAEQAARAALALDTHLDQALVLLCRALVAEERAAEALPLLQARVRAAPQDLELQLAYAGLLAEARDDAAARNEFDAILKDHPGNVQALYTLGLLALQDKDIDAAGGYFTRLLKTGQRNDDAYYFLGSVAEQQKHYPQALDWYHKVGEGQRWLAAQGAIGRSLVEAGTPEAAQAFFDALVEEDADQAVEMRLAEAQVFSALGQTPTALKIYDAALEAEPDNDELLYARSLLLEQDGDVSGAERDLQAILKREPEDADALNALGYTLTLHTTRYQEAQGYIAKALQFAPDDPAILDSMGWVEYRLGDYPTALTYLKQAYAGLADPEIAAHLVEVLLLSSDKLAAHNLWHKAMQANPDSDVLRRLQGRFAP